MIMPSSLSRLKIDFPVAVSAAADTAATDDDVAISCDTVEAMTGIFCAYGSGSVDLTSPSYA
jgi:hypothetical protein